MINNRPVTYKILWVILSLIAGVFLSLFIIYETSVNKEYYGTVPSWVAILISTLSAVANLFVIMQSSLAIKNSSLEFERSYSNSIISSLIPLIMEKAKIVNSSIKSLVENHTNPDSAHRDCCLWTTNFIQCFEIINSTSGENDSINKKCMNIFIKILTTDVRYELYNKEYSKTSLEDGLWEHANPQLVTEAYGHYERVKELYEQFN